MQTQEIKTDNWRQTKAMTWKHIVYKKRQMRITVWEIILPIFLIFYMLFIIRNECDSRECNEEQLIA